MSELRSVLVGERDYNRIQAVLKSADPTQESLLYAEIDAANVVPDAELPNDVVTMHSVITFIDLESERESTFHLVYPHEVEGNPKRVSILAPIGAALIGLKVGESIEWPLPNNKRKMLKVVSVEAMPA